MKWTLPRFASFLAVALTLWLWPSVFGGKVLLPLDILANTPPHEADPDLPVRNDLIADVLYENYAWKHFQRQAIREGELPLWNPGAFCGHPLYATGQASTFYPLNIIFWVVPLPQAYVVFTWLHLFLGGVFMYLLCRRLCVGSFGAAVGGACFALCGFFAVRLIWPMLLGSAIWLPLMLLWIDAALDASRRPRWRSGLAAGAVLFAMPMLSGFLEIAFYAFVACGLYTCRCAVRVFIDQRSIRPCAVFFSKCAAVVVLAAMLAAPQLVPFFEVMPRNIRAGQGDLDQALSAALEPHEAVNAIMPDAFGNPSRPDRAPFGRNNYVSSGFYLGLLPLMFAVLGLRARARDAFFFWLLLALAIALAFGTSLYTVLFHVVPGLEQVRTPFRWMFIATFAGCYLAAVGAQHWHDRLAAATTHNWRMDALKLSCAIGVLAVLLLVPDAIDRRAAALYAEDRRAAAAYPSAEALAELVWANRLRFVVVAAAAALCVAVAEWRQWPRRGVALASLGAITLVAADLGQATFGFNTHADSALLETTPDVVRTMQEDDGLFRVARYGPRKVLHPNAPLLYGLQDVGGYDSIILTDYARFLGAIEFQKDLPFNIVMGFERKRSLDSRLLPLLNVRYLLASRSLRHEHWEFVERAGPVRLYRVRREHERPRAFLVGRLESVSSLDAALERMQRPDFDPARLAVVQASSDAVGQWTPNASPGGPGNARITHYTASSVRIRTQADAAAFLVLCDVYYPGWSAYVDGHREEVVVTNGVFRGVPVPAGTHDVEFRFEPAALRLGIVLALAAVLLLVAAAFAARVRRRKPTSTDGVPEPSQPIEPASS